MTPVHLELRSNFRVTMAGLKYSRIDFLFTCVGLLFLLLDIVLDIYAAVSFYQEKAYMYLSILLLFLVGSSVLVQIYSWLFYSYDDFEKETVERCLSRRQLKVLHVLQLGSFFRWYEFLCFATGWFSVIGKEGITEYLSNDLSFLRLIETFSESAPQLILMLTIILQRGHLDPLTVLKAFGSAAAIAVSVTMYHRSLRSFLPDKEKQPLSSLAVYFLWNFLLISSRLTALVLFASVLPSFIFIHFVCSWLVLFFFALRSKTDFMESPCGEWLYRATVGLIWYFNWFNVVKGNTKYRTLLYLTYILVDNILLCSLWCWKMSTEPPYFEIPQLDTIITAACVVLIYILGLSFRKVYYQRYHPKNETDKDNMLQIRSRDGTNLSSPDPDVKHDNKKMRKLAENFYFS